MIIEGAFYKIPESLIVLENAILKGSSHENALRGIFYSAILGELNIRNAPYPATLAIMDRPYPTDGAGRLTSDIFVNLFPAYRWVEFSPTEWGIGVDNFVEIKYFRGKPEAGVSARQELLKDILKLITIPNTTDCGRYLLIVFSGSSPERFLSSQRSASGEWARQLLRPGIMDIEIDFSKETKGTKSRFGISEVFLPVLHMKARVLRWEKVGQKPVLGMLIRISDFKIISKIGSLDEKPNADLRKKYATQFLLFSNVSK